MKNEEVRKLLGGYATDTLTESERRALFEAALDDQELFNALEDEQALKQLLGDPVSREAIHRAVAQPVEKQYAAWWSRWWVWGGVGAAAAAAVLIVAVVQQNKPAEKSGGIEIASTRVPEKSVVEVSPAVANRELKVAPKSELPLNTRREVQAKKFARENSAPSADQIAPSAPPPPQPAKSEQSNALAETKPLAGLAGGAVGAAPSIVGGFVADSRLSPLRYSLLKKDSQGLFSTVPSQAELSPGDSIRLNVSSGVNGYLSLYQMEPSGEWKRIFPESAEGRLVTANMEYTIPETAIEVQNAAQRFRLSLMAEGVGERAQATGKRSTRAAAVEALAGAVPVNVDFSIGPGRSR